MMSIVLTHFILETRIFAPVPLGLNFITATAPKLLSGLFSCRFYLGKLPFCVQTFAFV
jgi:hypothetical protein